MTKQKYQTNYNDQNPRLGLKRLDRFLIPSIIFKED
jgi:hypothetical protein